jgi:hypothetical protein
METQWFCVANADLFAGMYVTTFEGDDTLLTKKESGPTFKVSRKFDDDVIVISSWSGTDIMTLKIFSTKNLAQNNFDFCENIAAYVV